SLPNSWSHISFERFPFFFGWKTLPLLPPLFLDLIRFCLVLSRFSFHTFNFQILLS
ncbi:hypothetical protein LEP1GSC036_2253, partial [Leptospira weilii str. 2006001853]